MALGTRTTLHRTESHCSAVLHYTVNIIRYTLHDFSLLCFALPCFRDITLDCITWPCISSRILLHRHVSCDSLRGNIYIYMYIYIHLSIPVALCSLKTLMFPAALTSTYCNANVRMLRHILASHSSTVANWLTDSQIVWEAVWTPSEIFPHLRSITELRNANTAASTRHSLQAACEARVLHRATKETRKEKDFGGAVDAWRSTATTRSEIAQARNRIRV